MVSLWLLLLSQQIKQVMSSEACLWARELCHDAHGFQLVLRLWCPCLLIEALAAAQRQKSSQPLLWLSDA